MNLRFLLLLFSFVMISATGNAAEIILGADTDSHGNVENLRKMHRLIRTLRQNDPDHFLLIDAGDTLQGTWECEKDGARTILALHKEQGVPFEKAICLITENVAKGLELYPKKGCLSEESDADLLILDDDLSISWVIAKGKVLMEEKEVIVKGMYED